jgi:hypothetical protein
VGQKIADKLIERMFEEVLDTHSLMVVAAQKNKGSPPNFPSDIKDEVSCPVTTITITR